jgi:hypothetical protein
MDIFFFGNGNTAALDTNGQFPPLQRPWLLFYAEWLATQGFDPEAVKFHTPNGGEVRVFKTSDGTFNWRFLD